MSQALITPELVALDLVASDRDQATRALIDLLVAAGRVTDADGFHADVRAREAQMATGMPGGIGSPHARTRARRRAQPCGRPRARWRRLRRAGRAGDAGLPHRGPGRGGRRSPGDPRGARPASRPRVLPYVDQGSSRCRHRGRHREPRGGSPMKFVAVLVMPDGHRAHLHGCRGAGASRRGSRPRVRRRDAGCRGLHALGP